MSVKIAILYIGATGYIGGSALQAILADSKAGAYEITAFMRSEVKAKAVETALGIKTTLGSLQDHALVTQNVEKADVVFQQADSDDVEATKAILTGLKNRYQKTGKKPIYIHTSGTAFLCDSARGGYASSNIMSDLDVAGIEKLPSTALHRNVDLLVVSADTEGYATTYIIAPGMVYGRPKGPLFDGTQSIAHVQTVVLPVYTAAFTQRGCPGIVGKAANIWPYVHIEDTADAFVHVLRAALHDPAQISHGREGYFFVASSEHTTYETIKAVGKALVELGAITNAEADSLTAEERAQYFGGEAFINLLFGNARCTADRLKELGWTPKHTAKDFVQDIKKDIEVALNHLKAQ